MRDLPGGLSPQTTNKESPDQVAGHQFCLTVAIRARRITLTKVTGSGDGSKWNIGCNRFYVRDRTGNNGAEEPQLATSERAGSIWLCRTVGSAELYVLGLGSVGSRLPRVRQLAVGA